MARLGSDAILTAVTATLVLAGLGAVVAGLDPLMVFVLSAAAIVPLSHFIGTATEELGKHTGPAVGGLLNASFGNATELIIALFAVARGPALYPLVKASLTGSIIGNILLVLGGSMFIGGLRHERQHFSRPAASTRSTMLAVATAALVMPSLAFHSLGGKPSPEAVAVVLPLSEDISVLLLVAYFSGLVFSLRTHRHLFNPMRDVKEAQEPVRWTVRNALLVLLGATLAVSLMSETLVGVLEPTIRTLGLNELFVGVIIVAVVGNAAEHSTALLMAWRNKMDLSVGIAASSSTQIALFVAPLVVLTSALLGNPPMDLAFELFELVAIIVAVTVTNMVSSDGESNWYEGILLMVVYVIIALGFYFHPVIS